MCSAMRWRRFVGIVFSHNITSCLTGKPFAGSDGLWPKRRWQHLQHRKGPAAHVWQVHKIYHLKPSLNTILRERGIENFRGSGIEKSTEESKESILRRIACIEAVHRIRCILVKECFIGAVWGLWPERLWSFSGLVGLQDSGKTTLLNKVWGLHGSTGLFAHTDVPVMHRITNKVWNKHKWHNV